QEARRRAVQAAPAQGRHDADGQAHAARAGLTHARHGRVVLPPEPVRSLRPRTGVRDPDAWAARDRRWRRVLRDEQRARGEVLAVVPAIERERLRDLARTATD